VVVALSASSPPPHHSAARGDVARASAPGQNQAFPTGIEFCEPLCRFAGKNSGHYLNHRPLLSTTESFEMGDETMRRTLYVGNLPDDITTKELNDEFRKFGRIVRWDSPPHSCNLGCLQLMQV
jgi:RNA recognition motif-containing protein